MPKLSSPQTRYYYENREGILKKLKAKRDAKKAALTEEKKEIAVESTMENVEQKII